MIIDKLILHHLKHGGDDVFYRIQALDSIRWLRAEGVSFGPTSSVLDLGCGRGIFGEELIKLGCRVTFADEKREYLLPALQTQPFRRLDLNQDNVALLGRYDLVICSNVLEHIARQEHLIASFTDLLNPGGYLYLSWTNWYSLWGGHDFSPFHFFGPRLGPWLWDKVVRRRRLLIPFKNLYPTHIGGTLKLICDHEKLEIIRVVPRYFTEFGFLMKIPILREVAAWNCAVLVRRRDPS